ncbi:deoxyhypusine hydroxylase-like [Mercenaria mercenaria]|uniref:deoxyhypusine hydroxylase-like n=1 Tax=Mercenaria mercenaria TaxID=6596 RepID=UPI00234F2945|nr:deoxyhypusine hydroxylase-like [Mercenaria mercenaria]
MTSVDKKEIGRVLNDSSQPLKERFRALFSLKNLGGHDAIDLIAQSFQDESALLKHELAYCLGQMQDPYAIPMLVKVLEDKSQEAMVRHEAGEALGAIGSKEVLPILEQYTNDPVTEVSETCLIAIDRIKWLENSEKNTESLSENPYFSVDPAPPSQSDNVESLKQTLLDENLQLFERYRALFSLRNLGTKDSVIALAEGLKCKSALFRHEIAYVLGQIQHDACVNQLSNNLKDPQENPMVRHECAEALGSIATDECMKILEEYLHDKERVVKESCVVALDMCEYENSENFQYADTMAKLKQGDHLLEITS